MARLNFESAFFGGKGAQVDNNIEIKLMTVDNGFKYNYHQIYIHVEFSVTAYHILYFLLTKNWDE